MQPHHDHACNPEEDDVETRDQHVGGVEALQRRILPGPAERGKRPKRGREPGVQHVLVLAQRRIGRDPVFFPHLLLAPTYVWRAVGVVPGGDAVPPPQLAADAPVFDVLHPVVVGPAPVLRHEAGAAVTHRRHGLLGQRPGADVPLVGQIGLDHGAAAVAAGDGQGMFFRALQQALCFQVFQDLFTRLLPAQAPVSLGRGFAEVRGVGKDVDQRQVVAQPHLVVVEVVRRRDLHATGTELRIDVIVRHDRDVAAGQRQPDGFSNPFPITGIVGMHRDRGCRPAWFPGGWWRPPALRQNRRWGSAGATGAPCSSEATTSRSDRAVRSTGSQLTRRLPR